MASYFIDRPVLRVTLPHYYDAAKRSGDRRTCRLRGISTDYACVSNYPARAARRRRAAAEELADAQTVETRSFGD